LLNGKKGSHVTNAGIDILAHIEAIWASVLDVVRHDKKSLTAQKQLGIARAILKYQELEVILKHNEAILQLMLL